MNDTENNREMEETEEKGSNSCVIDFSVGDNAQDDVNN